MTVMPPLLRYHTSIMEGVPALGIGHVLPTRGWNRNTNDMVPERVMFTLTSADHLASWAGVG